MMMTIILLKPSRKDLDKQDGEIYGRSARLVEALVTCSENTKPYRFEQDLDEVITSDQELEL